MALSADAFPALTETSTLGILHLRRFWYANRAKIRREVPMDHFQNEWPLDSALLSVLGLGLEQLYRELPAHLDNFAEFERWIEATVGPYLSHDEIARFNAYVLGEPSPPFDLLNSVLSKADVDFWDENGYLVLHDAVPPDICTAAEQLVWDHLEMDRNDPATWYKSHPAQQGIMVQLFQHPALFATRRSERIRRAYEELWQRTDLWTSVDRVGFNPPETVHYKFPGPRLHFDVSLAQPIPLGTQGILYLADTEANQGALTLVPGFHRRVGEWLKRLPPGTNPRAEDLYALGAQPIAGKAGDFIIWHQALPHGSSPNTATRPRIVQYINLQPANLEVREKWI
jgi:ectoine hydroxylase-related dioxygenase (phytanoyl-CoA dioxygenase family)